MLYRLEKFAVGITHLLLILVVVLSFFVQMGWAPFLTTCLLVSAVRLAVTYSQLNRLLETFEDHLSRMQILVPLNLGLLISVLVLVVMPGTGQMIAAFGLLAGWARVYQLYRQRQRDFIKYGHGPLPANVWVNPPAEAIQPGDLILTDGRMARRTRNSVGHVEIAIPGRKGGKLVAFSSYMEQGVVMHTMRALLCLEQKLKEHYIVLRLRTPFTPDQNARAIEIAEDMERRNVAWRDAQRAKRMAWVRRLPMPARLRNWLLDPESLKALAKEVGDNKYPPLKIKFKAWLLRKVWHTGYDWTAQYTGFIHKDRWTCMGAVLEMLQKLGVPVRHYGTGMLGLGTGLFNPLLPIRLMSDPCYRLVTMDDKAAYDAASAE